MTALALDVRELSLDETAEVSGAFIGPIIGIIGVGVAIHMYAMQRGAADHDANCKEH